jgi:hypothetical protein
MTYTATFSTAAGDTTVRASLLRIHPLFAREVDYDREVRVYRNLRRKCYSIVQDDRVVAHATALAIVGARFAVSAAGRARARRDGRKNVHAWVIGKISLRGAMGLLPWQESDLVQVRYDHRDDLGFRTVGFAPQVSGLRAAEAVILNESSMSAAYFT